MEHDESPLINKKMRSKVARMDAGEAAPIF